MTITGNPFVSEGVRTYFSDSTVLRSYFVLVGALSLVLLFWWPHGSLESVLWGARMPDTFTAVAVIFLLFLVYLGARYGSEDYASSSLGQLEEYVTLTPVPLVAVVIGKVAFALLHTIFLLGLGAPFLLAPLAVTGAGAEQALDALLVIGAATFAARTYGLLLLTLLPGRQLLRDLALMTSAAMFLALTTLLLPAVSPVAALLSLSPRRDVGLSSLGFLPPASPTFSIIFDIAAALLLAGGALVRLGGVRRHARKS